MVLKNISLFIVEPMQGRKIGVGLNIGGSGGMITEKFEEFIPDTQSMVDWLEGFEARLCICTVQTFLYISR